MWNNLCFGDGCERFLLENSSHVFKKHCKACAKTHLLGTSFSLLGGCLTRLRSAGRECNYEGNKPLCTGLLLFSVRSSLNEHETFLPFAHSACASVARSTHSGPKLSILRHQLANEGAMRCLRSLERFLHRIESRMIW